MTMNKLLSDAKTSGFDVEGEKIYAPSDNETANGSYIITEELTKFAELQIPQWKDFKAKLPPDNVDILLGKYHDDEIGWYWIITGAIEEGKFYERFSDDEVTITTSGDYLTPKIGRAHV